MSNGLLEEIHMVKNHSLKTRRIYSDAVKTYTEFCSMTLEELIEAAKLSNSDKFINVLPDGYETVLKLSGANLSPVIAKSKRVFEGTELSLPYIDTPAK